MQASIPPEADHHDGAADPYGSRPGELDLFAYFLFLRVHLRTILLWAFTAFLLMTAYVFIVKPRFAASASMIVPQPNTSAASLALQAAAGLDLVGGGNEIYTDILKSRTIADRLIQRYDLETHYHVKELNRAEEMLASNTVMSSNKEGLLQVTVQDEDPKLAADIANSYFNELDLENQRLAIGSASEQRRYFEKELVQEKNALADAEIALKRDEEKTGVVEPGSQVQAKIAATEGTRAQLRMRQVQLAALEQSETAQNPDVIRVRGEVAAIEAQLRGLESQGGPAAGTPASQVPEQSLVYVRDLREVKYHETLFELLSREYEAAKEREAKDVSSIEILDKATPPPRKSWPPRKLYCIAAFFMGGFLGIAWITVYQFFEQIFANPANQARLRSQSKASPSSGLQAP